MDVSRAFFDKLRGLCLMTEKEAKRLERALRREDTDDEDESPLGVLNDLHCEIRTLKEDINASLHKSCSEKQQINDFMKASEILMQRNAADLEKIREVFAKYSYKPQVKDSTEEKEAVESDSAVSPQEKSDDEKADEPHLPAGAKKPLVPQDPLRDPRLSDFGLSQYSFPRLLHTTSACQDLLKSRTPLKTQSPCVLAKTPKCMLKMDDYECVTPKLEHFGISEHTMCMNEDYTMSLIHRAAPTSRDLVKKNYPEFKIPKRTPREIVVTPGTKPAMRAEKAADWMASPMVLVFCTPEVKISSRKNHIVLSGSPETNELPPPSHTETPRCPDFQTRWLKTEAKQIKQEEAVESEKKNDATEKYHKEDKIPLAVSSDDYLKHFGDPSPPELKTYDQLLSTPPPPEITRIPDDVLQLLSKYDNKAEPSKDKEMETKAGNSTRHESGFTNSCNKENRGYHGFSRPNI